MPSNIFALAFAQSCYWFAVLIGISLSSIIGVQLAPHASLATLPFALVSFGALLSTYQLSLLMQKKGRRRGLRMGAAAGMLSALLCMIALSMGSFTVFCVASFIMGLYQASAVFYRLAAIDEVVEVNKGRVMGWVLSGSLFAAIFGPTLAQYSKQWFSHPPYLGAYLCVAVFAGLAFLFLGRLSNPCLAESSATVETKNFLKSPLYREGLLNTVVAQFVMMLMMVITPLAMHAHHHATSMAISVIAWHIIGMFLPSFFSGKLIDRYGSRKIALAGLVVLGGSAIVAISGKALMNYYCSLFLLGVGWNFLYMSGSGQYASAINEREKGKGQGLAELIIAISSIVAVIGGGALINWFDWQQLNIAVLVLLFGILGFNGLPRRPS